MKCGSGIGTLSPDRVVIFSDLSRSATTIEHYISSNMMGTKNVQIMLVLVLVRHSNMLDK